MSDHLELIVNGVASHTRETIITYDEVVRLNCSDPGIEWAVSMTTINDDRWGDENPDLIFVRLTPGDEGVKAINGDVFHVFNLNESNKVENNG